MAQILLGENSSGLVVHTKFDLLMLILSRSPLVIKIWNLYALSVLQSEQCLPAKML